MQLRATDIARDYGFTPRHWARLAAAGKIPGARQPGGRRGHWVFDRRVFVAWWQSVQREGPTWPGYTVGGGSIGAAPSVKVESTAEASKHRIEQLLSDVLGRGGMNSTRAPGARSRLAHSTKRQRNSFENT
jgi:hypothetical protein